MSLEREEIYELGQNRVYHFTSNFSPDALEANKNGNLYGNIHIYETKFYIAMCPTNKRWEYMTEFKVAEKNIQEYYTLGEFNEKVLKENLDIDMISLEVDLPYCSC